MIEGALILLAGILIGRLLPGRRKARRPPEAPEAVCGCRHHYSFHDPESGRCHGTDSQATAFDGYGIARAWKQIPCTCRKYAGPEPLPTYYAPEIATGESR